MKNHPVWAIGFRPFFLLGSITGSLLILYWSIHFFTGNLPGNYFDPISWHAHEMIYGFTVSIIAGFLLTASANWTGTKPLEGKKLKVLFGLWLLGRLTISLSILEVPINPFIYLISDILFIPGLVLALAPPLISAKKLHNTQFLLVLALLTLGNLLMHLSALGIINSTYTAKGIYLGLNLILLILIVISGRVVPFFTKNAIPGIEIKKFEAVEHLTILSTCVFVLLDFFQQEGSYTGWVALLAAAINFIRMLGWRSWKLNGNPLLWILHLGYFWIVIGFLLVFLSDIFSLLPRSVAIHAFTAGAMGIFILGMMSRVSLGHSGRPLKLAKGFVFSYLFLTLAGVIRVGSGFFPELYGEGILISGIFWSVSFLQFLFYYFSILISPRADGRPG